MYFRLYLSQNAQVKKKKLLLKQLILIIKGVEERMLHNAGSKEFIWNEKDYLEELLIFSMFRDKDDATPNEQEPWVLTLKIKA